MRVDIAIIGGGVVGCAIARHLVTRWPDKDIVVIEKHEDVGMETSSKNSGVIHSGIHQDPRFLKTRLALRGSALVAQYAEEHHVPIIPCGMIIPVSYSTLFGGGWWGKIMALRGLVGNAKTQDIRLSYLTPRGIKRLEKNIKSVGGLFVPDVAVIDAAAFVRSLRDEAEKRGVLFLYQNKVEDIAYGVRYVITTGNNAIYARVLINAAGLYADDIARMACVGKYIIYPWRGEYYEVAEAKRHVVRRLVYPPPSPHTGSKGIHISPRPDGRLYIGPNARLVQSKTDYQFNQTPVSIFYEAIRRFCPLIEESDLTWAYAGIRAKNTPDDRDTDYIICVDREKPPLINLIGIDSPGLTASLAIAEYVADLLGSL